MWDLIFSIFGLCILPLALIAWFTVSLVMFLKCPKENVEKRKNWKLSLLISAIILGTAVTCFIALVLMFAMAIMFM